MRMMGVSYDKMTRVVVVEAEGGGKGGGTKLILCPCDRE